MRDEEDSTEAEAELKRLKRKRATMKANLTKFHTALEDAKRTNNPSLIDVRLPRFEQYLTQYEELHESIEELEDSPENEDLKKRFEDTYYSLLAAAKEFIKLAPSEAVARSDNQPVPFTMPVQEIKLPHVDLVKFSGRYEDWTSFIDLFDSMVHNSRSITKAQKLLYLRDALLGEAKEVIKYLSVTADNYDHARELLKERYEKTQLIINAHIKALFEQPVISKENAQELRSLVNNTKQRIRSIEALKVPVGEWDPLIVGLIKMKLDPVTSRQWELEHKNQQAIVKLSDLYDFLDKRCFSLEAITSDRPNKYEKAQDKGKVNPKLSSHVTTNKVGALQTCKLCSQSHRLYQCDILRNNQC